jgi:hypothetical protein
MKNYFFGINGRTHSHFDNRLKKDVISANNYEHVRYIGKVTNTDQSVVSSTNWRITGGTPEERMKQVKALTDGNPNIKLSKETYDAIMSGDDINLKIDKYAPERRNLLVGLAATIGQVIGGLAGAAYTKELGDAVSNRVSGDADFVTKHGRAYSLNPFGGAEVQGGQITATRIGKNDIPSQSGGDNKQVENKIINGNIERAGQSSHIDSVDEGVAYKDQFTRDIHNKKSVANSTKGLGNAGSDAVSINENANDVLAQYGKALKNGNSEKIAYVDVSEKGLTGNSKSAQGGRQAALDYLELAHAAGLIDDGQLKKAQDAFKSGDGKALAGVFHEAEGTLKAVTGNIDDLKLGGQHITNLQKVLNDKIKEKVDLAGKFNDAANGGAVTFTDKEAEQFNKANGLTGDKALNGKQLTEQIQSGNLNGISNTVNQLNKEIQGIATTLEKTAGGAYGQNNKVLENTIGQVKGDNSTFSKQVGDLNTLIAAKQGGGTIAPTTTGGKNQTIAEGATSVSKDLDQQLQGVGGKGKLSDESVQKIKGNFNDALGDQLKANGIKGSDGKAFSKDEIDAVAKEFGAGGTGANLVGRQKELFDAVKGNSNPSLKDNFTAAGQLFNKIDGIQKTAAQIEKSGTISSNVGAVSQAKQSGGPLHEGTELPPGEEEHKTNKLATLLNLGAKVFDDLTSKLLEIAQQLINRLHESGFNYGFTGENYGSVTKGVTNVTETYEGFKNLAGKSAGATDEDKARGDFFGKLQGGILGGLQGIKDYKKNRDAENDPNQIGTGGHYLVDDQGNKVAKFKSLNEHGGGKDEENNWFNRVANITGNAVAFGAVGLFTGGQAKGALNYLSNNIKEDSELLSRTRPLDNAVAPK